MAPNETESNKAILALSKDVRENRIISERIDGKVDRIRDSQKVSDQRVEALLDVVTGSKTGAKSGLIVRVHDLEQKQAMTDKRIDDILDMNEKIDRMEDMLVKVIETTTKHPSLLYSLRFETKKTIMWILFAFVILSLWFVSDFRNPILELFGIPIS